jgi:integrase
MKHNIKTKTGRDKLPPRPGAYFETLSKGCALGFRRGPNTWIARLYTRDAKIKKFEYHPLGQHEDFSAAKVAADNWFAQMGKGIRRAPTRGTVRDALASYVRHLRSINRRKAAWEVGKRFRLTVGRTSEFGRKMLESVMRDDVEAWRNGLRKGRKPRSINRQVRAVVAALNHAVAHGHIGRRDAWKIAHLVDDGEENVAIFLTTDQRDRLIAAAPKPLAALLNGYAHTGARPSELANAVVADFDSKGGKVTLKHHKGRGGKQRTRAVVLSDEGIEFFRAQIRGKLPQAPLISDEGGGHWTDQHWCDGIARAVVAANAKAKKPAQRVPAGTSAYAFRHTRISELLQTYGIDPVTVAAQCGTSVLMIEKSYFKFISSSMRDKLNAVKSGT